MNSQRVQPRVGLDCLALPNRPTGAGLYISLLAQSLLARTDRPFRLAVFCKPGHTHRFSQWLQPGDRLCPVPVLNRAHLLFTYEFLLPMLLVRHNIQLFHATHYLAPPVPPGMPLVLTVHDLGIFLYPENYPLAKRLYLRARLPVFLQRATSIVAISRTTAGHLAERFPRQAARVRVVYHGTDHLPEKKIPAQRNAGKEPPFLLSVNAFEPRKNIPFLIQVFERLRLRYRMPHRLVLAGYAANGLAEVEACRKRSPLADDIQILVNPERERLLTLYHQADAFLSASRLEGFGFTPLEAVRCRLPVFLYANPAVRELFPPSPALFPHLDADRWAEQIFRDWLNGFSHQPDPSFVQPLTWQRCARETMQVYQQCFSLQEVPAHVA
ncbi:MAG: glycosyltransferase family 1 protein [Calditrichaeota bacterium]|nr:MAG: glycosyltransferase family 1 protein [Calditrichota bacterium]